MNEKHLKGIVDKYHELIPEPFDILYDQLGYESVYVLAKELGGTRVYIPTLKFMFRPCMQMQIQEEFDGQNGNKLARKYGFCETTIRVMVQ